MQEEVFVTQPSLPDFEEFISYMKKIWKTKQLTNNGPFHRQFEEELAKFLNVKYVSLFTNATLALIASLQVLRINGEVITTPYTFVALSHSLYWNNIKPIFCDIKSDDCNIDEDKIESLISTKTTAILPVHVYGNPCNYNKIKEIADIYGLKVIYDAAHSFNVKENDISILNYGDLSILSFHATKVFNTFEGGAIICHDKKTKERIDFIKNFGFKDEVTVVAPGINAKMNEFQSVIGILQLKNINAYIEKNKLIDDFYREALKNTKGIRIFEKKDGVEYNYSYFPILVEEDYPLSRDMLYEKFIKNGIFVRRYFYPLVTEFSPYKESNNKNNLQVAYKIASHILCLPIYPDLEHENQKKIISIINNE